MKTPTFKSFFCEDIESKLPYLQQQFPDLSEEEILGVVEYDPTGKKGKYAPWILKQKKRGADLSTVGDALNDFSRLSKIKGFEGSPNINSYNSLDELLTVISNNKDLQSKTGEFKEKQRTGAEMLGKEGSLAVIRISNPESAAKLCRKTEWCVKDPKYSKNYLKKGPLYMVTKDNKPYALIHLETTSAKDVADRTLSERTAGEIKGVLEKYVPGFSEKIAEHGHGLTSNMREFLLDEFNVSDIDLILDRPFTEKFKEYISDTVDRNIEQISVNRDYMTSDGEFTDEDIDSLSTDLTIFNPDAEYSINKLKLEVLRSVIRQLDWWANNKKDF